jgi:hypothetical protein
MLLLFLLILFLQEAIAFNIFARPRIQTRLLYNPPDLHTSSPKPISSQKQNQDKPWTDIDVLLVGLPGKTALEVGKACLDMEINVLPFGFAGPTTPLNQIEIKGKSKSVTIELYKGLGQSLESSKLLKKWKSDHARLIAVDFTRADAAILNIQAYVDAKCDFIMGTRGFNIEEAVDIINSGKTYAVISPNMVKELIAIQGMFDLAGSEYPDALGGFNLQVITKSSRFIFIYNS